MKYSRTPLKSVFSVRAIYTIHYFKYMQKFSFEGERHPFWEFVYIDSGEANISADEGEFTLTQGEGYFHKPDEYHSINTSEKFANSVIISFDCHSPSMKVFENCRLVLSEQQKSLLKLIVEEGSKCYSDKLNEVYLTKMHPSSTAPFGSEQLIKSYIEQFLVLTYRQITDKTAESPKPYRDNHDLTQRIIEILEENLSGSISLEKISASLFFSKTYLKSVFKKNTGKTIMQYFTDLKIEEAKRLISFNKFTFTEIAYKLGYSSLYYFSRQFKKCTTMSLTEYAGSLKLNKVL